MKHKKITIVDTMALDDLLEKTPAKSRAYSDWIRIVRDYLRMTQAELASRAHIPQSHVAAIESGKIDPRIGTLQKIFNALSCGINLEPSPLKPLAKVLRGRARSIALKRLKQSTGSMAMEGQAPNEDVFLQLLEKQTDQILSDRREKLWNKK